MNKHSIFAACVLLLLVFSSGCLSLQPASSAPSFRTLSFANATLSVEMAATKAQIETGLMGRTSLGGRSGMLFDMGSGRTAPSFYMYRTLIPLDAIFLDENMYVVDIQSMTPCASEDSRACKIYTSRVPARYVLEVNAGFADKNGIKIGDKANLKD